MIRMQKLQSFTICLCLLGCGAEQQSPSDVSRAEGGYEQALAAFEAGDYQLAENQLTDAIDAGGLNSDLVAEAYLLRAEARGRLGQFQEAMADLAVIEQAAPNEAQFHRVRGDLLLAQGDRQAAHNAYDAARKIDSSISLPDELR